MKIKKLYDMNAEELLHRRRYEQISGIVFSILSVVLFMGGMYLFERLGSFYGLISLMSCGIVCFIVVLDCSQNLNTIGLHLRMIKEHEK